MAAIAPPLAEGPKDQMTVRTAEITAPMDTVVTKIAPDCELASTGFHDAGSISGGFHLDGFHEDAFFTALRSSMKQHKYTVTNGANLQKLLGLVASTAKEAFAVKDAYESTILQLQQARRELSTAKDELRKEKDAHSTTRCELAEQRDINKKLKTELQSEKDSNKKLKIELAAAVAALAVAEGKLVQARADLKKANEEIDNLKKKIHDLEIRLNEKGAEIDGLKKRNHELELRLNEKGAEIDSLKKEIERLKCELRTCTQERDAARAEATKLKEDTAKVNKEIEKLKHLKGDLEKEVAELEEKYNAASKSAKEFYARYEHEESEFRKYRKAHGHHDEDEERKPTHGAKGDFAIQWIMYGPAKLPETMEMHGNYKGNLWNYIAEAAVKKTTLTVSNDLAGGDPQRGWTKAMTVAYTYRGELRFAAAVEGRKLEFKTC